MSREPPSRLSPYQRAVLGRLDDLIDAVHQIGELTMSDATQTSQLDQDVQTLTAADADAENRVAAEVANLSAELDALRAGGTVDPAALAGIEAVTARLQALAPATPAPAPAQPASPTPAPSAPTDQGGTTGT